MVCLGALADVPYTERCRSRQRHRREAAEKYKSTTRYDAPPHRRSPQEAAAAQNRAFVRGTPLTPKPPLPKATWRAAASRTGRCGADGGLAEERRVARKVRAPAEQDAGWANKCGSWRRGRGAGIAADRRRRIAASSRSTGRKGGRRAERRLLEDGCASAANWPGQADGGDGHARANARRRNDCRLKPVPRHARPAMPSGPRPSRPHMSRTLETPPQQ